MAKLILESLHECETAQLLYCENQDTTHGSNFTPTSGSLIVLNAALQERLIFTDLAGFQRFQAHCQMIRKE